MYRFADSRIGHMCLLDGKKVDTAEKYFARHGAISTFIGRLVPAVRQLISIPAGLARMKFTTFIFYTTLGAGIWNSILAVIGYSLHSVVPREELMEHVERYSLEIGYVFLALAAMIVIFLVYKGMKKEKSSVK